ncbi:FAD binding domain-containing protein [Opitutia bacterium ISCC 51]|nr:FAD binding domain-containing protein [Opitutae bacterium ISCC 51]QXD26738.1 FAD binding domain-containing protein [Opitutae bacterium ISCC 52]
MNLKKSIRFILNDQEVNAWESPGRLALDFLRDTKRLTGTKEGCKEGDCGACAIILGSLQGDGVAYTPMTSCLIPVGELEGKHLVTIEGLNMKSLSPVQAAMVDTGGTQCGYCTPGFVVAMTAWLMDESRSVDLEGAKSAMSGNLCRCTGYRSIKEAGSNVAESLSSKLDDRDRVAQLCEIKALPDYFIDIPKRLAALQAFESESATSTERPLIIGGGTDLYVQRGEDIPDQELALLNLGNEIPAATESNDRLIVDARMTFQTFGDDPLIQKAIPEIQAYNELIASWPIRTRATLGGNICNASPIADMTCLLLALDSELQLGEGDAARSLALKEFFQGYKQLAKTEDEVIESISFSKPTANTRVNWEKVSKRAILDIATVNSAARFEVEENRILEGHLALGGVAAIPLYLKEASAALVGKEVTPDLMHAVVELAQSEFDPISDVRGSAGYKRLLARQLLLAHFLKCFPEVISEEVIYAAL